MLKNRIKDYWENRADNFFDLSFKEMRNERIDLWKKILTASMGSENRRTVLDLGTGAGYIALVLASMGHEVTGIDLSPKMVASALKLAEEMKLKCNFLVADAEQSGLPDNSFDVIISRNLTWTLPNITNAYQDWYRILRQGGRLMIFDGDYGDRNFSINTLRDRPCQDDQLPRGHAHVTLAQLQECDSIKNKLEISKHRRPSWDLALLENCGFSEVSINFDIMKTMGNANTFSGFKLFGIQAKK